MLLLLLLLLLLLRFVEPEARQQLLERRCDRVELQRELGVGAHAQQPRHRLRHPAAGQRLRLWFVSRAQNVRVCVRARMCVCVLQCVYVCVAV